MVNLWALPLLSFIFSLHYAKSAVYSTKGVDDGLVKTSVCKKMVFDKCPLSVGQSNHMNDTISCLFDKLDTLDDSSSCWLYLNSIVMNIMNSCGLDLIVFCGGYSSAPASSLTCLANQYFSVTDECRLSLDYLLENIIPCVDEAQALCPNEIDPEQAMYCLSGALQIQPSAFSDQCKALVQNFIACEAMSSSSSDSRSYTMSVLHPPTSTGTSLSNTNTNTASLIATSARTDGPWTALKRMGAQGRRAELTRRRASDGDGGSDSGGGSDSDGDSGRDRGSVTLSSPSLSSSGSVVSGHWTEVLEARRLLRRLQGQEQNITCINFDEDDESSSGSIVEIFDDEANVGNGELYYYYGAGDDYKGYDDGGDDYTSAEDDDAASGKSKNKHKNKGGKGKGKGNGKGKGGDKQSGKVKKHQEKERKKKAKHNDDVDDDDTRDTYFGGFHAEGLFFGGVLFILLVCVGFVRFVVGPIWSSGDTRSGPARAANTNFGRRGWDPRGTYVRAPLQEDEEWEQTNHVELPTAPTPTRAAAVEIVGHEAVQMSVSDQRGAVVSDQDVVDNIEYTDINVTGSDAAVDTAERGHDHHDDNVTIVRPHDVV